MRKSLTWAMGGLTALLVGCNSSGSLGGDDEIASHCVAVDAAEQQGSHYVHTLVNVCDKVINVMEPSTRNQWSISPKAKHDVTLSTKKPAFGACFEPYEPDVKESSGRFQCRRK